MCDARDLLKQIKHTENDIDHNLKKSEIELPPVVCYALPVLAFTLAFRFHRKIARFSGLAIGLVKR